MSFLERLRSPGSRALRDAGPPTWWVVAAFVAGGAIDIGVAMTLGFEVPWAVFVAVPGLLTLGISIVDRDGWLARDAIAYVGIEQRRRMAGGSLPATPGAADRWLADHANDEAPALVRVSALITANRYAEAREVLGRFVPADAVDEVRRLRLEASIRAAMDDRSTIDIDAIGAAVAGLPADEARYHVVSAAWTQAWLDLTRRRPWRARFVAVTRPWQPFPVPRRIRAVLGIQQLAAPLAFLIVGVGLALVLR